MDAPHAASTELLVFQESNDLALPSHEKKGTHMHRLVTILVIGVLIAGCAPKSLTPEQRSNEEKAISSLVTEFWNSYGSKNWAAMNKLFTTSGEFACYGTDLVRGTKAPWQSTGYESAFTPAVLHEFSNFSIQFLDNEGERASVFCQLTVDMTSGGKVSPATVRFAAVVKKENGEWRIMHSMAAFPVCTQMAEQASKPKETEGKKK
jgi:hypothetical protein